MGDFRTCMIFLHTLQRRSYHQGVVGMCSYGDSKWWFMGYYVMVENGLDSRELPEMESNFKCVLYVNPKP